MAFDVSGLVDYVDQSSEELILRAQLENRTASLVTKQSGIKSSAALQLFDTDAVVQDGDGCGYNSSGTTTLSQRLLVTGAMKVQEDLCPRDLEKKWTQIMLNSGQDYDSNPAAIAAAYMTKKVENIQDANEVTDWQGDLGGSDFYDGFLTVIDAAASSINGNTGGVTAITGIIESNVYDIFKGIIKATLPAVKAKADFKIFCGMDVFDTLVFGLIDANNFHFNNGTGEADKNYTLVFPGTRTSIEGVPGLDGTDRIIAATSSNMHLGCDLESEDEEMKVWYSMDDDVVKHSTRWRRGTQVAYPDEITQFTLVP